MTIDVSTPPHKGRRYLLMAAIFAITMAGTTLPAPLYPIYQQLYGYSNFMVTVIFAIYAAGVLAALIITGPWSDQLGRRPLLGAGLIFAVLSNILFLSGGSLAHLLIGRFVSGLSAGLFTATATVAIIELAPDHHKARAALAATIANMGGLGLGPVSAGFLSQYLPAPLHLCYALHLLLMIGCSLVLWRMPETVVRPGNIRLQRQSLALPAVVRPVFIPAAIASLAAFGVMGLFTSLSPAMMGNILNLHHHAVVGTVVCLVFMSSLIGQFLQRRLTAGRRLPLACLALVAGLGLLAGAIHLGSLGLLIAAALTGGIGQGGVFAASVGAISSVCPADKRGEVISLLFVVAYIAVSIPVVALGFAVQSLGLRLAGISFALTLMALTLVALLILLFERTKRPVSMSDRES